MALLLLCGLQGAQAADALRGKTLYLSTPGGTSCANSGCHGTNVSAGKNKLLRGANSPTTIQNAINRNTGGMGIYRTALTATDVADIAAYIGNPSVTATAPAASITPTTLSFAATTVGSSSASQTVTVRNSGTGTLTLSTLTLSSSHFVLGAGTCSAGGSVAAGASCTVLVSFRPASAGALSGTLSIGHNATGSPGTVSLSGTGTAATAPAAAVAPASLSFGAINVGSQSATLTATLSNTGTAALPVTSISSTTTDFPLAGGTCTAGGSVAVGGSCTVLIRFVPAAAGAASATLSIVHGAAGSPATVALSGTGVSTSPVASVTPASLSFSQQVGTASAARTVTLSNTGTAALVLGTVSLSGTNAADYSRASGSTCSNGLSVAAGASCIVNLVFTPGATGARNATLSISHNDAAHSPTTVALAGSGTAAPRAQLSLDRLSISFTAQPQNTPSAVQTATVSNSGSATATLSSVSLGGTHAADYSLGTTGSACRGGNTLAVGASCTLDVRFTPSVSSGTRTATVSIVSDASNSPASLGLSGIASAAAAPMAQFTPASLAFGSVTVGSSSAPTTASLRNSGTATLTIGSLVASPSVFLLGSDCGASLAPAAQCTLTLSFAPSSTGAVSGSVTLTSNVAGAPLTLPLSGTGAAPGAPALAWTSGAPLAFADTAVGASSATQSVELVNAGTGAATLQQITVSGAHAADFVLDAATTCPSSGTLAAGARCSISVVFAPGAAGPRSAQLGVIASGSSPAPIELSGNGVAVAGTPQLTLAPEYMTLSGPTNEGLQPQALMLSNTGGATLRVLGYSLPADLVMETGPGTGGDCPTPPFSLAPGQGCSVMVMPTGSGAVNGEITVLSNADPVPVTVKVSGQPINNAGAGGCSVGRTQGGFDPIWLLMLGGSAFVLWRRRGATP